MSTLCALTDLGESNLGVLELRVVPGSFVEKCCRYSSARSKSLIPWFLCVGLENVLDLLLVCVSR